MLPLSAFAASDSRGVVIKIKDDKGKEISLYKESHALIVGASAYTAGWPKLPGVRKDVEEVKSVLERQGFHVVVVMDPNRDRLVKAYEDFINRYGMNPENRLLFYFAGHGHTVKQSYGEEMGYIVPVDAPNPNKDQHQFLAKAMDMQMIEVFAKRIQSKHALFLFDSCFSGSLFALSRAVPESISYKTAKPVRQFITSGSADEQVPDTSVFKQQFVSALNGETDLGKNGYITGTALGEYLQDSVVNYSRGAQHPQYGKIRNPNLDKGDFVFQLAKAVREPEISIAAPSTSGFSMDDLETQGKQMEQNKAAWSAKLKDMQAAYRQVMAYEKKDVTADLKASAWERFSSSFGEDNPYSTEDDGMRGTAQERMQYWQAQKTKTQPQVAMAPRPKVERTERFSLEGGVIDDSQLGLQWAPANGQSMNHYDAEKYAQNLSLAGGGWRLPTRAELKSLYDTSKPGNADPVFGVGDKWVWTSELKGSSGAWALRFNDGYELNDGRAYFALPRVLAVRSRR